MGTLEVKRDFEMEINGTKGSYSGTVNKDQQPHGIGIFGANGGSIYEGQFKNGRRHGFIRMFFPRGELYHRQYEEGAQVSNKRMN